MNRFQSLIFGVSLPYLSARLILRHRALVFWSAIPLLLTAALSFWIVSVLQESAHAALIQGFVQLGWNPDGVFAGILKLLSRVLLIVVGAFVFSFSASTVATPFNDFLAEKAEALATPPLPSAPPTAWRARIKLIRIDVAKSLAAAAGAALALVFSFVPIINLFVFAITFLLIAFQFLSYPQTRRSQGIVEGLGFIRAHFWASLGFGAVTSLLFSIPVIAIFALPLSVVGGTLLFARARAERAEGEAKDGLPPLR